MPIPVIIILSIVAGMGFSEVLRRTYGIHEMTDADHEELCRRLLTVEGFVVLSSYPNPIYDEILEGWKMVTVGARAQCNSQRVEALYLSPRTVGAIQMPLLEVA